MKIGGVFLLFIVLVTTTGCYTMTPQNQSCPMPPKFTSDLQPREIYATDLSFDSKTGEIKYTLPEPALVRIRIGIRDGGALLKNLLDWDQREAGPHKEIWDGKDTSGQMNFLNRPDLMLVLNCIPIDSKERNQNTVIKGFKKSPQILLSFPDAPLNTQQKPILKGKSTVRVSLNPEDHLWLSEERYELGIYIDQTFLIEDEEGLNPFNYQLDTSKFNNGLHLITVNLTTYTGETGSASMLIEVNN